MVALLAVGGCSFVDRLETLERDQAHLAKSVTSLNSRYASLESETRELIERQEKVEAWIRRLGSQPGRHGPSPAVRPMAIAPVPAIDARHLLRGGVESVVFDNQTDRIVMIHTARGPSFVKGGGLDLRVLPAEESAAGAGDSGAAGAPGVHRVPCGGRLVASATVDTLLFVEAQNGEPCKTAGYHE